MNNLNIKLYDIIKLINKDIIEIVGDQDKIISCPIALDDKITKNGISFCENFETSKFINLSSANTIVSGNFLQIPKLNKNKVYIIVSEPRIVFIRILNKFFSGLNEFHISETSKISENSHIDQKVHIGEGSIIGKSSIGKNTIIYDNVSIYDNVKIGSNCVIHSGTVIGSDGYHFHRDKQNTIYKFPSLKGVIIGDNVEIGSNVSIDKGTLKDTIIKNHVKIDNFVHIGHTTVIEDKSLISAGSILGGNVKIGKNVWVGLNSTISNNIYIGDHSKIRLGSVVIKNVEKNKDLSGNFARAHLKNIRSTFI